MARFVEHLTDAWGEYWSGGDPRAAGLIYRPDVRFWNVARGRTAEVLGVDAVAGERFSHLTHADRVGVVVGATVVDGPVVVVEFVSTTSECGAPVAVPGCAWWWVDDDGRIGREEWWTDPGWRRPATPGVTGRPLRGVVVDPGADHRRRLVGRIVEAADADPGGRVGYTTGAVVDLMGEDDSAGAADRAPVGVERRTTVHEIAGSGSFLAWTQLTVVEGGGGADTGVRTWPEARVCVLDHDGLIAGEHRYRLRPWLPRGTRGARPDR